MAKRTFTCGLDAAISVMGGKWKGLILFSLSELGEGHMDRIEAIP